MITDFQKKITPYLDGTLNSDERSEFEAFVATHPEFEPQIKNKETELNLIRSLIPSVSISAETKNSLENEMKQSIYNLLKSEPKSFLDNVKNRWEEWLNR